MKAGPGGSKLISDLPALFSAEDPARLVEFHTGSEQSSMIPGITGLNSSAYINAGDTGARHNGKMDTAHILTTSFLLPLQARTVKAKLISLYFFVPVNLITLSMIILYNT